jgi:hypothetical protein
MGLGPALELVGAAGEERHGATAWDLLLVELLYVATVLLFKISVDLKILSHFLLVIEIFLLLCHVLFIVP